MPIWFGLVVHPLSLFDQNKVSRSHYILKQDATISTIFDSIKRARFDFPSPYWDDVSNWAKDLVEGMLTADPQHRLTCR